MTPPRPHPLTRLLDDKNRAQAHLNQLRATLAVQAASWEKAAQAATDRLPTHCPDHEDDGDLACGDGCEREVYVETSDHVEDDTMATVYGEAARFLREALARPELGGHGDVT